MKYIKVSKISKFISNAKKWILNKLPIYNDITFVNLSPLEDIGRYETTLYIGQFYQNSNIQQSNTIILPAFYFKDILTKNEQDFDSDILETRYNALFGVHQDFYWLYFQDANVFISFYKDKIAFTLNNASTYKEFFDLALSAKNPNRSIYVLYKDSIDILIERSRRIIEWIYMNQEFKDTLISVPNSYWCGFFNEPLDLSWFKNTTFEIINPKIHLPKEQPIGSKIILYPFFHHFYKSKGYLSYHFLEYRQCYTNDLENYLKDYYYPICQKHNTKSSEYWEAIEYLTNEEDSPSIRHPLLESFYRTSFHFKNGLDELDEIAIPSHNSYYLFGFMIFFYRKSYEKIWGGYNIHSDNGSEVFVQFYPYNGENLEPANIDILDKAIKQGDDYIGHLNGLINKTKGNIDLSNQNTKIKEYYQLLTFLNKELEKAKIHQEYLDYFKYQLFPPDDEVI